METTRKDAYGWWVEKYNKGEIKSSFIDYHFGTDNQPTGTGKASEQINDMTFRISGAKLAGKKVLLDLASHRLTLSYQLAGNAVYCLKTVNLINPRNTVIVVNSSDNKEKYSRDPDLEDFTIIGLEDIRNIDVNNYMVVSCYRSHYKLENLLKNGFMADGIKVDYWDEAHLVSTTNTSDEAEVNIPLTLSVFNNVYAFSATPKKEVTRILSDKEASINPDFKYDMDSFNGIKYIKHITIKEAIESKQILPVNFQVAKASGLDRLEAKLKVCIKAMEALKKGIVGMPHKVLVNLTRAEDVVFAMNFFKEEGYDAFGTTSKYGFNCTDDTINARIQDGSITSFANEIKKYPRDCFVIHIEQLVEGFDSDCLDATVLFSCPGDDNISAIIQIIGRLLRFYKPDGWIRTERGMDISERIKKFGYVFWAVDNANADEWIDKIVDFFLKTYDCGECECKVSSSIDEWDSIGGSMLFGPSQNGYHDAHESVQGFSCKINPVYIDTIDALIKFLPYAGIQIPGTVAYQKVRDTIIERLDGCVDKIYTTEDWLVKKNVEISNAKKLMIEKEPKLEDLFKSYGISVK